jgi:hypothetical protein
MSLSSTALVTLIQAKNFLKIDHAASLHIAAEYVGTGDDVETEFTLDNTPLAGTLKLYVDNVLQVEGTDFTISSAVVTFTAYIPNGDIVTASYDYSASVDTFESYDDELLEFLIDAATTACEDYTGRVFITRAITEKHMGDGTTLLKLYKQPVTDVTSVTIGSTALTSWTERLSVGRIYYDYGFDLDYEVTVVYTAGESATRATAQAAVPRAVMAVLVTVANWYENRLGLKSQNISGVGSVDFGGIDQANLPPLAKQLLSNVKIGAGY